MGIPLAPPPDQTPGAGDKANAVVDGTIGSATNGDPIQIYGVFNAAIWGTFSATVILQKSFDGGTTWIPATYNNSGTAVSFTAPAATTLGEPEAGVLWRWNVSAYTSGTVSYRLSASGTMGRSASATTV